MNHVQRLSIAIAATLLFGVDAGAGKLIRDINAQRLPLADNTAFHWTRLSGTTVFLMNDGVHGEELWRTDGTAAGTALVRDICPGPAGARIFSMTVVNGVAFFVATDGTNGQELWRSDGTSAGTRIVADVFPGAGDGLTSYVIGAPLSNVNGVVYFVGSHDGTTNELWRSDGTSAGTYRISAIANGGESIDDLTVVGSRLFFVTVEAATGKELWSTDGTLAGTKIVADINPGAASSGPSRLTPTTAGLFFMASDATHGAELWFTNSDAGDVHMVADFAVGQAPLFISGIAALGADVIFSGNIWESLAPGTPAPASSDGMYRATRTSIQFISPGVTARPGLLLPEAFAPYGGRLLFTRPTNLYPSLSGELWVTDGTSAGTQQLGVSGGLVSSSVVGLSSLIGSDGVYFGGYSGQGADLWRTDGTPGGTGLYAAIPQPVIAIEPVQYQGKIWLAAGRFTNNGFGSELWTTNGISNGMVQFADLNPGPDDFNPRELAVAGSRLFFSGDTAQGQGPPWVTDGTVGGTLPLIPSGLPYRTDSSNPHGFAPFGSRMMFIADSPSYRQPWISDGTTAGTTMLSQFIPNGLDTAQMLGAVGSRFLFVAHDLVHGMELWGTDGTAAGTYLVKDINPGAASSDPAGYLGRLAVLNGVAYFPAYDGVHLSGLWRSDGTTAGTYMVTELPPIGGYSNIYDMHTVNGKVLFQHQEDSFAYWWTTDGTAGGTHRISSAVVSAGLESVVVGGYLYFSGQAAPTAANNRGQLWRTDGTTVGTQQVADLSAASATTDISHLTSVRGRVLFTYCASLPQYHCDLYASDGTTAGTVRIGADGIGSNPGVINGASASAPTAQLVYSMLLDTTSVLRVTDGTAAGTHDVLSWPAPPIYVGLFTSFLGQAVFTMTDASGSLSIWRTDGTATGTVLVDQGGANEFLTLGGNQLIVNLSTPQSGTELFAIDTSGPNVADDSVVAAAGTAVNIAVLANDGTLVSGIDKSTVHVVTAPSGGVATVVANGAISYTGNAGFSGIDQFTYTVRDLQGGVSNVATVFVIVAQSPGSTPGTAPTPPPASGGPGESGGSGGSGGGASSGGGGGLSVLELLAMLSLAVFTLVHRACKPVPTLQVLTG